MVKLKEMSTDTLKEHYRKTKGHYPSWLGEILGWTAQHNAYNIADQLAFFIDKLFPDYFPLSEIQNLYVQACQEAYQLFGVWYYIDYATYGDQLDDKFNAMIDDYKARINNAVAEAKTLVENEFILPLQHKANTLNRQIELATAKLSMVSSLVDQAQATLTNHETRLQQLELVGVLRTPIIKLPK